MMIAATECKDIRMRWVRSGVQERQTNLKGWEAIERSEMGETKNMKSIAEQGLDIKEITNYKIPATKKVV